MLGVNSHSASIKHAARVATVGSLRVRSDPLVLEVDHGLSPKARVCTDRARLNWTILGES